MEGSINLYANPVEFSLIRSKNIDTGKKRKMVRVAKYESCFSLHQMDKLGLMILATWVHDLKWTVTVELKLTVGSCNCLSLPFHLWISTTSATFYTFLQHLFSGTAALYNITLQTYWTTDNFPKQYPTWRPPAQW